MTYGYIIVDMQITDMEQYKLYMASAPESVAQAGGEYLARGGAIEVMEGDWTPGFYSSQRLVQRGNLCSGPRQTRRRHEVFQHGFA